MDREPPLAKERDRARLLIADDNDVIRSGLKAMLAGQSRIEVIGEAVNGREALELCRRLQPDLVLMDVRMPEMNGLAATRAIKREFPQIAVLIITSYENPGYLFEALKAGAAGYVLKDISQQELIAAVHQSVSGESLLDPQLATQLLRRMASEAAAETKEAPRVPSPHDTPPLRRSEPPLPEPLTARELEVLRLLARGQTNREIAQNLMISTSSVKLHVRHIIAKLEVSDRLQAAVHAIKLGLITPD